MDLINSTACRNEVVYFEKMEVSNYNNDVILAANCRADVDKFCKAVDPGKVQGRRRGGPQDWECTLLHQQWTIVTFTNSCMVLYAYDENEFHICLRYTCTQALTWIGRRAIVVLEPSYDYRYLSDL
jgi:hypothetical protein